jgi:hypothetical protein
MIPMLILCVLVVLMIAVVIRTDKQSVDDSLSHWHQSLEGVSCTPREFYDRVRSRLEEENLPGLHVKVVAWHEGGIHTEKRDYLRVRRGDYIFDLCAAPVGNSFFVSSWLSNSRDGILEMLAPVPFIGWFARSLLHFFAPVTYFRVDSAAMFHALVHNAMLAEIDEMTTLTGSRIPDTLRRPVMREIYAGR